MHKGGEEICDDSVVGQVEYQGFERRGAYPAWWVRYWDSIEEDNEVFELTDAQRDEIDRRLASLRENPEMAITWEELKKRVQDSI